MLKNHIEACKKGNRKAQLYLYKSFYKAMYNTSLRIVNDQYEAEDIMQEAFLTAFTRISEYKGEVSFGAWLKKIVVNKSINKARKQSLLQWVAVEDYVQENEEDFSEEDHMKLEELMEAMQFIKDKYRIALSLYYIEGYDHEEIAKILSISNANSRTLLSRAKGSLQKKLALANKV